MYRKYCFCLTGAIVLLMALLSTMCTAAPAPEGTLYAAYYLPDAIEYAGNICLYLKNPTNKPLTITEMSMDGESIGKVWVTDESFLDAAVRDEYIEVTNDQLAWYRVFPNPVPGGGITEVILRLMPPACEAQQHELSVTFAGYDPVRAVIAMEVPAFALEYVGINSGLDELHIYARRQAKSRVQLSRVEIDGRVVPSDIHAVFSGYSYAKVELSRPWEQGSFHAVAVGNEQELRAVLIRALPTPPPIGIFGNVSEREVEQYMTHLFDANLAFTPAKASRYDTLDKYGLRGAYEHYRRLDLKPGQKKPEPIFYDRPEAIAEHRDRASLWGYFLEDEPDGRYHLTSLPRAAISRDVERANQFCRIFDPRHPTYLQMNHGGYPRNMYIYGQIPDYIATHAFAMGGSEVIERTQDHVVHTRASSRPRAFYYLNSGYCGSGDREPEPYQMRLEVHTALACGAKSLQWYPAHGGTGLLAHPKMWNAVGEMNGILHQVLPLLAIGTPVGKPIIEGGKFLSSCILCGDKAMVVVLVNKDFTVGPEKSEIRPKLAEVSVRLPAFMKAVGVAIPAFPGGIPDIPAEISGSSVRFRQVVGAGMVAVVYTDEAVFEQMRQIHAKCLERFQPMPEE